MLQKAMRDYQEAVSLPAKPCFVERLSLRGMRNLKMSATTKSHFVICPVTP